MIRVSLGINGLGNIYVCMHVCMHSYMHICICIQAHTCMYAFIRTQNIHTYVYIYNVPILSFRMLTHPDPLYTLFYLKAVLF